MGFITLATLVGAVSGALAWAVLEPTAPIDFYDSAGWLQWQIKFTVLLGALVAGSLGGLLGYYQGSRAHLIRGLLVGGLIGAIGGSAGMVLGGSISQAMFGDVLTNARLDAQDIPARMVTFAPFGALIGLVMGVPTRSWRQAWLGMLAGTVGGTIAGSVFDSVSLATQSLSVALKGGNEAGIVGRAVTSAIIGGCIGLVSSVVQRATRSAWLRLSLGRNEGREWLVDAGQTFIGRSENAHVPLFGDMSVAPMHACIVRQGGAYVLMDGGSPIGTYLNGQRVLQMPLYHGAIIGIGTFALEFRMRMGQAPQRGPEAVRAMSFSPVGPQTSGSAPMPMPISPPAASGSSPTLIAMSGPLAGNRYEVKDTIEIGREAPGIQLGFDSSASRRHAQIALAAGGLLLTDLSSTNGTFVNEQRVASAIVKRGDIVRIGTTAFRIE